MGKGYATSEMNDKEIHKRLMPTFTTPSQTFSG